MYPIFITLHVFVALGMIALILMQQGKGADIGSAFGAGASATLFGARGSANFLTRTTAILATVFFLNSILLAYLVAAEHKSTSLMQSVTMPATRVQPASDVPDLPPAELAPRIEQVQPASVIAPLPEVSAPLAEPATVVAPAAGAVPVLVAPEPATVAVGTTSVGSATQPASVPVAGQ